MTCRICGAPLDEDLDCTAECDHTWAAQLAAWRTDLTEAPNYEGCGAAACEEHRTVGSHRAWCFTCQEWCYPAAPCARGELQALRGMAERNLAQES